MAVMYVKTPSEGMTRRVQADNKITKMHIISKNKSCMAAKPQI